MLGPEGRGECTGGPARISRSNLPQLELQIHPASTPCGLPVAGAQPSGRPTAPVSPPGVPVEPAGTVRHAAACRDRNLDVTVGGDTTRKIGSAAVVYDLTVYNLHAITVGPVAAAALRHDEYAPRAVERGARSRHGCSGGGADHGENAGADEMTDHWGLVSQG